MRKGLETEKKTTHLDEDSALQEPILQLIRIWFVLCIETS